MKKLVALCLLSSLMATTVMSTEASNQEYGLDILESAQKYEAQKDEFGRVYDLGGIEIIVRDWWSPQEAQEPTNEYQETRQEYLEWAMATYNFTIKEVAMSDWSSTPRDYVEYVNSGGDENYYLFAVRDDSMITEAMENGLMFDLSSLSCLDFSEEKFERNRVHEKYSYNGKSYAMYGGYAEPRRGIYFNKRLLLEAGVDPESIYDMQADGTWTWDAWTDIMETVQRDIDGDGVIDVYGFDADYGNVMLTAIYSNGGEVIGKENGKYTYDLEEPESVEAMEWFVECMNQYALVRPEEAYWDYYKDAFINGECAFLPDELWAAGFGDHYYLKEMEDEVGFVMFPKGPMASDYVSYWNDNNYVIPACYDKEKAWRIAFAYDIYTDDVPGYENYFDATIYEDYVIDERAKEETIPMMLEKGMVEYYKVVSGIDIGEPFTYKFYKGMPVDAVSEILDGVRERYKACVVEANKQIKDVSVTSWQYKYVKKIMDLGIMNGKAIDADGNVTFDPNNDLTRAEFVRALYNKENKPSNIQYTDRFKDVKEGQWYTDAILWAADNGLVNGKKADYFDVHGKITREEIATILYKYAVMKEYDVSKQKDFSEYEDGAAVSDWAVNYMKWALGNNIMKGQGSKIAPGSRATRAESATMITNFMTTYEDLK